MKPRVPLAGAAARAATLGSLIFAEWCVAHSHIASIVVDGVAYPGFNPFSDENPAVIAGWSTDVVDDGWVGANDYEAPDMICHLNATMARGYVSARAGQLVSFRWNGWPESHHGPVLTYLARCGDGVDEDDETDDDDAAAAAAASCAEVDKEDLRFFEIDATGLVDPKMTLHQYPTAEGVWGSDLLIYNNNTFTVRLPRDIAAGFYVLRHEVIALHFARLPALGPQHYPQCVNLKIESDSDEMPVGLPATRFYGNDSDIPGLTYDIYASPLPEYSMPGPSLYSGAGPKAIQIPVVVESQALATPLVGVENVKNEAEMGGANGEMGEIEGEAKGNQEDPE